MQYDLAKYRHMQPDMNMPSKSFLYFYSKYRKDREEAKQNPTS